MRKKRDALSSFDIQNRSELIFKNIVKSGVLANITEILTFVNYSSECDTSNIINYCFENEIKIAVPRVEGKYMDFYYISSINDLKPGTYGIMEPITNDLCVSDNNNTLIIMPGLIFDEKGGRIGYGGGYYDKYLSKRNNFIKVAICFDFQIINDGKIIIEDYDIKPDIIITDKRIIMLSNFH